MVANNQSWSHMDSITQFALGAAIGELTMGRKIGNRAMLWGGIIATLPDLDVFIPYGGAVEDFTYHRSATHSLIVLSAITPLIATALINYYPNTKKFTKHWFLLVFFALVTHPILDCFTVYGTQIFWPISDYPVAWSSIFIIDPAYTVPLMIGLGAAALMTRASPRGHWANSIALTWSVIYLGWTLIAQNIVTNRAIQSLEKNGTKYSQVLINPAPFNSVLWRVLVMTDNGYLEGFYSLLDKDPNIKLTHYQKNHHLLASLKNHWPVQRLKWFTRGYYAASQRDNDILMTDLRMGMEPYYIFRFKVGEYSSNSATPVINERRRKPRPLKLIPVIYKRIWNEGVSLMHAKN